MQKAKNNAKKMAKPAKRRKVVSIAKVSPERKSIVVSVYRPRKSKTLALNKGIINQIPDIVSTPLLKRKKDVIKTPANYKLKERLENLRIYTPGGFVYKYGTRRQTIATIRGNANANIPAA